MPILTSEQVTQEAIHVLAEQSPLITLMRQSQAEYNLRLKLPPLGWVAPKPTFRMRISRKVDDMRERLANWIYPRDDY